MAKKKHTRYLESTRGAAKKFWEITLEGAQVTIRQGPLGTDGKSETRAFLTARGARETFDELARAQEAKGYRESKPTRVSAPQEPPKKKVDWRRPRCFVAPGEGDSSLFWEIHHQGESFTVREGLVGSDGETVVKAFPSSRIARKQALSAVEAKVAEGFREVPCAMLTGHRLQWLRSHRGGVEPYFRKIRGKSLREDPVFGLLKRDPENQTPWEAEADIALMTAKVPLLVEADDEGPTEAQAATYRAFRDRQLELRSALREALFEYYQGLCEDVRRVLGPAKAEVMAPVIRLPEEIWRLLTPGSVFIPEQEEGKPVVVLDWSPSWDDDLVSVHFENWQVTAVEKTPAVTADPA